jgi:hypothetical protein
VRAFVEMDYVARDNFDNFVRLGFVLEVHFTYVVLVSSKYLSKL